MKDEATESYTLISAAELYKLIAVTCVARNRGLGTDV
jgi:hypothetical protein